MRALATRYANDTGGRIVIADKKGIELVDTNPPTPGRRSFASRPEFVAALKGEVATGTRHSTTLNATFLYVAVPIASGGRILGAVRVSYPTSTLDARVRRYWIVLAGIAGIVLAVAGLLGASFARWISRPLAGLEQAATRVSGGDLSVRAVLPDGPPELRALTLQFNEMVVKLDALVGAQRDFVADASHELRTPLTALRLRLENLERDVSAEGRPGLDAALAEIERLSSIVESLLVLARADVGSAPSTSVDIVALAGERVATWRAIADERAVGLRLVGEGIVRAQASADRVTQVLDNLLANALDATPAGGQVTVSAVSQGSAVELRVSDTGPGLSAEQKARAFDRFWRAGTGGGGSGLGLSIARRLVEADGGTIELRDAAGGGLEAVLRLST